VKRVITRPMSLAAAVAVLVALVATAPAHCSGIIFGVRPGQMTQSAYIGTKMGSLVPMVGLDFLALSVSAEDTDMSASIYIPHAGVRVYLGSQNAVGSVRPYLEGSFMYSIASVDLGGLGAIEKTIEDVLTFWGFNAIFGAEYSFSERFGVSGEYGLRYIKDTAKISIDAGDIITTPVETKLDAAFKSSYVAVGLNFHF
jgi:hypothetical protein